MYKITAKKDIKDKVELPVSKSLMNRYLTLRYMAGMPMPGLLVTFPDDVATYRDLLSSDLPNLNAGDAGTAMRFSTALFSVVEGKRVIRGSERMYERPIGPLVDALRGLGADIRYEGREGFPPLSVNGGKLKGGIVKVPADISSQFISALLMVAPRCSGEVIIEADGTIVSRPYIKMTISMMEKMGVKVVQDGARFIISPQTYLPAELKIECDWSAASFLYQVCALSASCELELPGLSPRSTQGDRKCAELYSLLGVSSNYSDGVMRISRIAGPPEPRIEVNFSDTPDLVQPFFMTCAGLGIRLTATGLYNLRLKETDRLKALEYNLKGLGYDLILDGSTAQLKRLPRIPSLYHFKAFGDHRMAMSIAPLALVFGSVMLDEIQVVEKSFPGYWKVLQKLGFTVA